MLNVFLPLAIFIKNKKKVYWFSLNELIFNNMMRFRFFLFFGVEFRFL